MGNKLFQSYFVVRPYIFFNHQQFNHSYGFHSSSDTHSSHSIVKPKVSDERYTLKPQLPLSIAWQNDRVFSVHNIVINHIIYCFSIFLLVLLATDFGAMCQSYPLEEIEFKLKNHLVILMKVMGIE